MNAKHIESRFTAMGARLKVREIASRWQMGIRKWIDPVNYAVDIRRDRDGEFFEHRDPEPHDGQRGVSGLKQTIREAFLRAPLDSLSRPVAQKQSTRLITGRRRSVTCRDDQLPPTSHGRARVLQLAGSPAIV